ncbi:MAG: hypothetical protein ACLR2E_06045 [Lachnospiraceae bacterium]
MEEIEASAFLSLDHLFRQFVVLFTDLRNILLADGVIVLWLSNHRLHGNLLEAEIRIMQDILGKVEIVMGKGTSHIVFLSGFGCRRTSGISERSDHSFLVRCGRDASYR